MIIIKNLSVASITKRSVIAVHILVRICVISMNNAITMKITALIANYLMKSGVTIKIAFGWILNALLAINSNHALIVSIQTINVIGELKVAYHVTWIILLMYATVIKYLADLWVEKKIVLAIVFFQIIDVSSVMNYRKNKIA